jgi:hypothetical protein
MAAGIAYQKVFGINLIIIVGILTFTCLLITASIPILRSKGIKLPYKLHKVMAGISIALALFHAFLGLSG